jgi:hypothetical protein
MKKPELPKPPKALDAMVATVLAYRPKPKTKSARKRQRARRRLEKDLQHCEINHDAVISAKSGV